MNHVLLYARRDFVVYALKNIKKHHLRCIKKKEKQCISHNGAAVPHTTACEANHGRVTH